LVSAAPTLMIMAGGTGGHIMPGLAVADFVRSRGWSVVWLGNPEGMEARLVPPQGYPLAAVRFSALRGKGLLRKLLVPLALLRAFADSVRAIRRWRPDVVLGFGGYVTFPGGMMASLLGRPLVIHEQNAIAGLTNRVLARLADRVLCGFPHALPNGEWCGNPVRQAIAALPAPRQRYEARRGPLRLLVVGGSLGAAALNETVPLALARIDTARRPRVRHQAGERNVERLRGNYAAAGVEAECLAFIDDMAAAYADADLVICRAGALTVAEVAAAGVAAIFVPYPHAVDDHQTVNAGFLAEAQAAILLPQSRLEVGQLAETLRGLDRPALASMAERARALAKAEATQAVALACEELGGRA
jgi:UDP-N-acetylglucosamine--N-acetylmuramyl-(pentapeptide) pyrophosphoryl-undecaprenol N-acetylglucosamine transferase